MAVQRFITVALSIQNTNKNVCLIFSPSSETIIVGWVYFDASEEVYLRKSREKHFIFGCN